MKKHYLKTSAVVALIFTASSVNAAVLVYEGFQYENVSDDLNGKDGTGIGSVNATGLSGAWGEATSSANDTFLKTGSLAFSSLETKGNHVGHNSHLESDRNHRNLTASVQTTIDGIGAANGKIFFSFLFEKLDIRNNADREGFALMNGILPASRFDGSNNPGATGRHGFAVAAVDNSSLKAVAFNGGVASSRVVSTGSISASVNTIRFIVGEISFNTGAGGTDEFSLYTVADDGDLDASDLTLVQTIEADVDESTLTTLNLTRQVNVNYDEIRIGETLNDVLPVPEPSAFALSILSCSYFLLRRKR